MIFFLTIFDFFKETTIPCLRFQIVQNDTRIEEYLNFFKVAFWASGTGSKTFWKDPEHCILNTITDQQSRNYALKYSKYLYKKNVLRRHSVAGITSVGADRAAACFLTIAFNVSLLFTAYGTFLSQHWLPWLQLFLFNKFLLASGDLHVADTLAVVPAVMVHGKATTLIASLKCC